MKVLPSKSKSGRKKSGRKPIAGKAQELNRLSLLLTLTGGPVFHRRGLGDGPQGPD